ncbi:beta-ketoacyl synthase N-terminal-like domain-containing protein [Myxococcus xanthus]|uniref:beta-ketoacyl synthase N-terminal-like domain-containing protein n=1 Tax=Myxococcus xanthus TaxID=34 RepID=UPI001CEC2F30|nr:beta-ketoacyl synthase N-terminal-like domain-containing protein [Myxococcus xanthus]
MSAGAELLGVGMMTPVGVTAPSTAAAIRAGIIRTRETPLLDLRFRPYIGAFIPEEYLPVPGLPAARGLAVREQRMLRLALPALKEAAEGLDRPVPLMLGLPEGGAAGKHEPIPFLKVLSHASGLALDMERSRCFPKGRAAGLLALDAAVRLLDEGRVPEVLVGGVDSLVDPMTLAALEGEGRIRQHGPVDGLIPGEGGVFLWLGRAGSGKRLSRRPLARIVATATGIEPGHRYCKEPYLGEGLAEACRLLFASVPAGLSSVRCVYAGFNGERFWAKEWGVAFLRSRERFVESYEIKHPAENVGDPGAAYGPLMVGVAALGLRKGYCQGPVLVWCSSDHEARGAALLHQGAPEG